MGKKNIIFGILILAVLALFIISPETGFLVRSFFSGVYRSSADEQSLALQNIKLKADLAVLQNLESQIPKIPTTAIAAQVYSRYPFNLKNELLINRGAQDGIRAGAPVFFGGTFLGEIEAVFQSSALVRTVFDERAEYSVRVGPKAADALFKGGNQPKLTLIDKKAVITAGDAVVNATPKFAYGLPIATIDMVTLANGSLFQEATLDFAYDINAIRNVTVLMNRQ